MQVLKILDNLRTVCNHNNVDYELFRDSISLKTANSGVAEYGIQLAEAAPTLVIKADMGILAVIIRGDTKISFKKLRAFLNMTRIRLAKSEEIYHLTGSKIGYVSLVNEGIKTLIDKKVVENQYVYGGCGINNYTLKIKVTDLIKVTHATIADFTYLKTNSNESG
ncbi:MAG: YbaK/EbsC family protein [Rickettsia endosymbiont of Ixodes persulcatus]|nr:YbaK/EbsC family protein [Rickettsia endosymbiont of Ixodes persulcatus]